MNRDCRHFAENPVFAYSSVFTSVSTDKLVGKQPEEAGLYAFFKAEHSAVVIYCQTDLRHFLRTFLLRY
jgi:hypothetical protein